MRCVAPKMVTGRSHDLWVEVKVKGTGEITRESL